ARFDQWNEAVHEALVTAGLRGPLREVTVPAETPLSPVTIS
ncbi:MAG: hypothetical protein JWO82_569, partial [Akkermansiaceae bacterium]|nr:hypothetical protein [Akkermansiaceae bacterium]